MSGVLDSLELELQPYQTLIVQIEAAEKATPTLAGVRAREIARSAGKISWEVFAPPGTKLTAPVVGLPKHGRIFWDGRSIQALGSARSVEVPLTFGGETERCFVQGGSLRAGSSPEDSGRVTGGCNATIPKGTKASVYALCLDPTSASMDFTCRATINGKPVPAGEIQTLTGSKTTLRLVRELPLKPWVFFRFPVPEGENQITISLDSSKPETNAFEVRVGWWLWTEQPLTKATLQMEFDPDLPSVVAKALPLPSMMEIQRQVIPLQALKTFSSSPSRAK